MRTPSVTATFCTLAAGSYRRRRPSRSTCRPWIRASPARSRLEGERHLPGAGGDHPSSAARTAPACTSSSPAIRAPSDRAMSDSFNSNGEPGTRRRIPLLYRCRRPARDAAGAVTDRYWAKRGGPAEKTLLRTECSIVEWKSDGIRCGLRATDQRAKRVCHGHGTARRGDPLQLPGRCWRRSARSGRRPPSCAAHHFLAPARLKDLAPRLMQCRSQVAAEREMRNAPPEMTPLDSGFIDLPQALLDGYRRKGDASDLGRVLTLAARLRDEADRVVLLGVGGCSSAGRALFQALKSATTTNCRPKRASACRASISTATASTTTPCRSCSTSCRSPASIRSSARSAGPSSASASPARRWSRPSPCASSAARRRNIMACAPNGCTQLFAAVDRADEQAPPAVPGGRPRRRRRADDPGQRRRSVLRVHVGRAAAGGA